MKNWNWIGLALLAGGLSSCVSKHKFVEAELRSQQWEMESKRLDAELQSKRDSLQQVRTTLAEVREEAKTNQLIWVTEKDVLLAQLDQQGVELSEVNSELMERTARLQELQTRLDEQTAAAHALRKSVADALVNFSSDELQVEVENGRVKVSLSENLLFSSGSVNVDPKGVEALGKLAEVLKRNTDVNIMIVGYTDSLSIHNSRIRNNWDLSVLRATTISSILQEKYGVDGGRLTAAGQAEFMPVATNATEEGRALNRRTEIYLSPKLDALMEALDEEVEGSSGEVEVIIGGLPDSQ